MAGIHIIHHSSCRIVLRQKRRREPQSTLAIAAGVTVQRSREFLVEPHRLQQLPTTSVIVTDATGSGRRVRLADANPAILTFPKTTLGSFEDVREAILAVEEKEPAEQDGAPPNLGPPPPRLDWRKPR